MTFVNVVEQWHENDGYIWVAAKTYPNELSAIRDVNLYLNQCQRKCTSLFVATCKSKFDAKETVNRSDRFNSNNMTLNPWRQGDWAKLYIAEIQEV